MNKPVRKHLRGLGCGAAVVVAEAAQQTSAAVLSLQPPASVAYSPGVAAAGDVMPGGFALLLWAPLLALTLLCVGGLLFLIWRQGGADAGQPHSAAAQGSKRRGGFGLIGGRRPRLQRAGSTAGLGSAISISAAKR